MGWGGGVKFPLSWEVTAGLLKAVLIFIADPSAIVIKVRDFSYVCACKK